HNQTPQKTQQTQKTRPQQEAKTHNNKMLRHQTIDRDTPHYYRQIAEIDPTSIATSKLSR
ncbi:hypothetical protein, partial [Chamaesiphon sp. OTE_20_metabat_361]|uniref:hypothetical protein n=1 Tax=Chamaesiphon sp. OTE_20_metabat_361 TaxID=2964689 RepID=UPI00286C6639